MSSTPYLSGMAALICAVAPVLTGELRASPDEHADRALLLAPQAFRAATLHVLPSVTIIEAYGSSTAVDKGTEPGKQGAPRGISRPGEGPTTGLIVASDGLILTSSYNFVRKQPVITVRFHDGAQHVARLVGRDTRRSLCLLKVDGVSDLPVPAFVDRAALRLGQWAISVGYGYGGGKASISAGVISGLNRIKGLAVQTDANLSPANYGGPLIDIEGRVIGISVPLAPNQKDQTSGTKWYDSGIGFAIPMHGVEDLINGMQKTE